MGHTSDESEQALIESWFNQTAANTHHHIHDDDLEAVREEVWLNLLKTRRQTAASVRLWISISAAAVILFFVLFGIVRQLSKIEQQPLPLAQNIRPAENTATLTLGNGERITLEAQEKTGVAQRIANNLSLSAGGVIVYNSDHAQKRGKLAKTQYNTLATPIGGHYRAVLPDGTRVWLNASSSIRYPVVFNARDRLVELDGEAYFEVAKDAEHPFKVRTALQEISVLGTHFNVNSYRDEPYTTTSLLEGNVKVSSLRGHQVNELKPGEQLLLSDQDILQSTTNVQYAVAWKEGDFRFDDDSIQSIMRMLSRWYNIEVVFEGSPTKERFSGKISNTKNISEVLNMLQKTKLVHFRIEGRRVVVMD
ncbi:FecR family protein [Pedobacter frigidisoli]|uniref:FecR family protein n=1 Tax=Pedobacter frigidisoli TaxID=2530455 RepID=UPI002931A4C8|nr:FecR domain-containing protein [Pedobacter frigidisoli]